jgi:hypothetical protein
MFDSSIDDRLHKLNEEFRKLLGNSKSVDLFEKTTRTTYSIFWAYSRRSKELA